MTNPFLNTQVEGGSSLPRLPAPLRRGDTSNVQQLRRLTTFLIKAFDQYILTQ